jgi:uncharacterized protein YndB with AHSA1/START domain
VLSASSIELFWRDGEPREQRICPGSRDSEMEIAASPELVWEVLTTVQRWPDWNPAVKRVSMQDGLAEGSRFGRSRA